MRVIKVLPGPANIAPFVTAVQASETVISAFRDEWLHAVREILPQDAVAAIKPFGKLVDEYLVRSGAPSSRQISEGYEVAAIAEACRNLSESSQFFACRKFPGAHKSIRSALRLLDGWNLDQNDLRVLAEMVSSDFSDKLLDLAFIKQESTDILRKLSMRSSAERKRLSMEFELPADSPAGAVLLIAGSEYEPLDVQWLKWLERQGVALTVLVDQPRRGKVFSGAQQILNALGDPPAEATGVLNVVAANVFEEGPVEGLPIKLRTQRMPDSLGEAEWILRDALKKQDDGLPLSRIAVFSRNLADSHPLFLAAAQRLGIPLRATIRSTLLTNGYAKIALGLLESCASADVRTLRRHLDSSYFALSLQERGMIIEGLRSVHRHSELQWEALETWAAQLNSFLDREPEPVHWLQYLLDWRRLAMAEPRSLREWARHLESLLAIPILEPALNPDSMTVKRDMRALSAMNRAISERASIDLARGGRKLTLSQFVHLAEIAWSNETYHVPAGEDGLWLVGGSAESIPPVDLLYVTGMLEGTFPRRRKEDPILTDRDRQQIGLAREIEFPNSHDDARAERDLFVRLCATPSVELVLSYAQTDDDRDNVEAFYLEEARRALGHGDRIEAISRMDLVPPSSQAVSEGDRRLAQALEGPKSEVPANDLITDAARDAVRLKSSDAISPREWRIGLECSFHAAAGRRLRVFPKRSFSLWNRLRELPAMSGLLTSNSREEATQRLESAIVELRESVASDADDHEFALLRAWKQKLISGLVEREFASRAIWPRSARSSGPVLFGEVGTRDTLKLGEFGEVRLKGLFGGISEVNGFLIGHVVMPSINKSVRGGDEDEELAINPEIGAYWSSLVSKGEPGRLQCGIEVESINDGKRVLFVAPNSQSDAFRGDVGQNLEVVRLRGRPSYGRAVKDTLTESYKEGATGLILPTPGPYCSTCSYGEICRSSSEFGETEDPFFAGDGND